MKQKKATLSFGSWRETQELKRSVSECSWFALILGTFLALGMGLRSDYTTGVVSKVYLTLAGVGVVLFLIGGFCPLILRRPLRLLIKGLNLIGKTLLQILLALLYLLFLLLSLPSILMGWNRRRFYHWNDDRQELPNTTFVPFQEQTVRPHSIAVLRSMNSIIHVLTRHKLLFLLPLVVILLILGLVFFFISAHSVFSFVYALF